MYEQENRQLSMPIAQETPREGQTRGWFCAQYYRLACGLFVALAALAFTSYVAPSQKAYANPKWEEITTGYASLATDPSGITITASTKTTMNNSSIEASVLQDSCTGTTIFDLPPSQSDNNGNSFQQTWFTYAGQNGQASAIPSNWYVNFSDPQYHTSLGCAHVQVDPSKNSWATAFFSNNVVYL